MKICLLSNALSVHTKRWINCLKTKGHDVYLISFRNGYVENIDYSCYEPSLNNSIYKTFFFVKKFMLIKKEIYRIKPDILHAQYISNYGLLGALVGYRPLVISAWGTDLFVDPNKSFFHYFLIKWVLKRADLITVMADHMIAQMERMIEDKSKVIKVTLGVDLGQFNISKYPVKRQKQKCIILSCRAFEKEQNIEAIIRSLPYVLKNSKTDIEIWFCNDGTYLKRMQELCVKLSLGLYVKFIGIVKHENMPHYYGMSDLYVSASYSDGDHVSLMEAMACGLFPIVSDIPSNRDWIIDGKNGFLVPVGDTKLFSEAILRGVADVELRKRARFDNYELVKRAVLHGSDIEKLERYYRILRDRNRD